MTKEEAIKTLKEEIEDTAKQIEETDSTAYRDELYGAKRAYKMSLMLLEQVDDV